MEHVDEKATSDTRRVLEDILEVASEGGAVDLTRDMLHEVYIDAEFQENKEIMDAFRKGSKYYKAVLIYAEKRYEVPFD